MGMLHSLLRVAMCVIFSLSAIAHASWQDAADIVDGKTKQVLSILEDLPEDKATVEIDTVVQQVDKALTGFVDFDYMAKRVMGKYYRRASAAQREEFSGLFKTTLLKTYTKALVGFDIKSYELLQPTKESPKPNKQLVAVTVKSGNGTEYNVSYYMLKQNGQWTLVNAAMDGINLRLTFKNQFASIAQQAKGKVDKAIDLWRSTVGEDKAEGA